MGRVPLPGACLFVLAILFLQAGLLRANQSQRRLELKFRNLKDKVHEMEVDWQLELEKLREEMFNSSSPRYSDSDGGDSSSSVEALSTRLDLERQNRQRLDSEVRGLRDELSKLKSSSASDLTVLMQAFIAEKNARKRIQEAVSQTVRAIDQDDRLAEVEGAWQKGQQQFIRDLDSLTSQVNNVFLLINSMNETITSSLLQSTDSMERDVLAKLAESDKMVRAIVDTLCASKEPCTHWSDWGPCSNECGSGTQTRTRICGLEAEFQNVCQWDLALPESSETRECTSKRSCCPTSDGYTTTESGYCFKVYKETKPNDDIKTLCEGNGDHLVTLDSEAKQTEFLEYARGLFGSSWVVLIEGRRVDSGWVDRHGNPLQYSNWKSSTEEAGPTRCIYIQLGDGRWTSTGCAGSIYSFFCERG